MRPLYCHGCAVLIFLFEASLHFVFKESMCCQFKTVSRHLLISSLLSSFLLVPNPKYSNLVLFFSVSFQSASYLFLLWRTDWDKQAELVSESLIFVENYQDVVHLFSPVRGFLPYVASVFCSPRPPVACLRSSAKPKKCVSFYSQFGITEADHHGEGAYGFF